jgi:hypothetical protein
MWKIFGSMLELIPELYGSYLVIMEQCLFINTKITYRESLQTILESSKKFPESFQRSSKELLKNP